MAITWMCGFEAGGLTSEPTVDDSAGGDSPFVVGGASLETTIVRSGAGSLKLQPGSGTAGYYSMQPSAVSTVVYVRSYIRVTTLPGTARSLWGQTSVGSNLNILLNTDGTLTFRNNAASLFTSSAALTDAAKWYKVDWKAGSSGSQLWIDDVSQGTDATNLSYIFRFGADDSVASTYTAYFDDVTVDGAAVPAAGKVLLAVPVSVNQQGSWTGGAGGAVATTAVDFPCAGTNSETDSTQIESVDTSGDNSTDECRINLTTYTNLGIGSSDTINAIMPFVWHGEDVSTGAKTGSFGMQANPADTYGTFTYGAAAALGTFNANWRANHVITSSPSVTLGNNPVIAVRKTDTGTRVASVCAMGMYVDYTPAVAALFKQIGYQVNQAVNRAAVW